MSYLTMQDGIGDFKKAVISFWFRVPKTSMDALIERSKDELLAEVRPRMAGIMPLVTFGKLFDANQVKTPSPVDAGYKSYFWQYNGPAAGGTGWQRQIAEPVPVPYSTGMVYEKGDPVEVDPCFVGVYSDGDSDPYLKVFLQTSDKGESKFLSATRRHTVADQNYGLVTGTVEMQNPMSAWDGSICRTGSTAPGNPWVTTDVWQDKSSEVMDLTGPDAFKAGSKAMKVTPDQWHHVLLSFELVEGSATGTYWKRDGMACAPATTTITDNPAVKKPSKIWIAFDDVNYTGDNLRGDQAYSIYGDTALRDALGDNGLISRYTQQAYSTSLFESRVRNWSANGCIAETSTTGGSVSSYKYPASPLPTNKQPFGIPAAKNVMGRILHVEMAEFLMWTGETIDTGEEDDRRAFIDDDGKPVPPGKKSTPEDDVSGSIEYMGRKPDVMLHKATDWIKGRNTGTTGVDDEGIIIVAGQFEPNDKSPPAITSYKPDPSLHGPQSLAPV